jgi:hypothetical protein
VRSIIVLGVGLAAACLVASTAGAITAPPKTYADATGDAGTAPDIARVTVTNDDHGLYRFVVSFATPYSADAEISLFLDTDQNGATGDKYGADYLFRDDHAAHSFNLSSWKGSYWLAIPHTSANVAIAPDNMSMTFTVNKSDLGNATKFNFFVNSLEGAGNAGNSDVAPDSGRFTYARQAVFTLSVGSSHDGAAKAGGTWTVSMQAVRSDTKATVGSEGSIACKATEGSKTLALVSHTFGSCTFRVPKTPKHAALHATISVSDGGQSASKSFTAKTK